MKWCPQCRHELVRRPIDGVRRLACSANCGYVFWDNPVPVVAALVLRGDHVVLARNVAWSEPVFSLLTGFLERDESPEDAVLREVKEELGLDGRIEGWIGCYPLYQQNQLILAYCVSAEGDICMNEEIAAVKCVSREALGEISFGSFVLTQNIVADWLNRIEAVD